jgi:RNA polymerase sigma-70 factor (ECF subfamily)
LLQASREGDHRAFRKLIEKYESKVAATVIGMLGHSAEAEDIGQETFIRFYRALGSFRGESSVGTYLTRIAINLSLNELKRRKRRNLVFSTNPEEEITKAAAPVNDPDRDEKSEIIRQGLRRLEPKFRSVVILRLLQGFTTRETADILGLPIGTVLSRLQRAQKKLKDILSPYIGGIP